MTTEHKSAILEGQKFYDVAVVGAGLMGSAVAKYVSEDVKTSILIGPNRPQDGVYAAWFDEGRITGALDLSINWRILG